MEATVVVPRRVRSGRRPVHRGDVGEHRGRRVSPVERQSIEERLQGGAGLPGRDHHVDLTGGGLEEVGRAHPGEDLAGAVREHDRRAPAGLRPAACPRRCWRTSASTACWSPRSSEVSITLPAGTESASGPLRSQLVKWGARKEASGRRSSTGSSRARSTTCSGVRPRRATRSRTRSRRAEARARELIGLSRLGARASPARSAACPRLRSPAVGRSRADSRRRPPGFPVPEGRGSGTAPGSAASSRWASSRSAQSRLTELAHHVCGIGRIIRRQLHREGRRAGGHPPVRAGCRAPRDRGRASRPRDARRSVGPRRPGRRSAGRGRCRRAAATAGGHRRPPGSSGAAGRTDPARRTRWPRAGRGADRRHGQRPPTRDPAAASPIASHPTRRAPDPPPEGHHRPRRLHREHAPAAPSVHAGLYISSACVCGWRNVPGVVARARYVAVYVPGQSTVAE